MLKNCGKEDTLNNFVFKYKGVEYNIDTQKLLKVFGILNLAIEKNDIKTNEFFKTFLKNHNLLVEEFIEYISKS